MHCNYLTVIMLRMYKAAAVLSALMKVFIIPCHFIAKNEGADTSIKQEEVPEDINFPDIKSKPDEVSYVFVCLLLDTFYHYPAMPLVLVMSVFLAT